MNLTIHMKKLARLAIRWRKHAKKLDHDGRKQEARTLTGAAIELEDLLKIDNAKQ